MTEVGGLKIAAIFVFFASSLLAFYFPTFLTVTFNICKNNSRSDHEHEHSGGDSDVAEMLENSENFQLLKSFSAGIILGVALLHLLPEGTEILSEKVDYPLSTAFVCIGCLFTLAIDQIAVYLLTHVGSSKNIVLNNQRKLSKEKSCDHGHSSHDHANSMLSILDHGHDHEHKKTIENDKTQDHSHEHATDDEHSHAYNDHEHVCAHEHIRISKDTIACVHNTTGYLGHLHTHTHSKRLIRDEEENKTIVKGVILEIAVAIHSIIIGFDFGTLTSIIDVKILFAALIFHQFFEGISLGAAILDAKLAVKTKVLFAFIFSVTFSIGIVIGMNIDSMSYTGEYVAGCANGFAAGCLIYSALVEMVGEDFSNSSFDSKPMLKMKMYFSLAIGIAVMAILAIYA